MKKNVFRSSTLVLLFAVACTSLSAQAGIPGATANPGVKFLGSILKITGSDLTLTTDQGPELTVNVQQGARIYLANPGAKDLKGATPIQFNELQVGDRVLVHGKVGSDALTLDASIVIVMKQQDIVQKKQQELLDWQRRSVGGFVKQVDAHAGRITLSVGGYGSGKELVVNTTPKTIYKRYAPESVKWEDSTATQFDEIHPGDQLRAKGNKNEDGTQLVAEEIVAGTFRNLAGLVTAIDAAQGMLTVQDLATKKPVTVKITADSQMKKLSPQMAQSLAVQLKDEEPVAAPVEGARPRGGDMNQLLARLPASTLGDLQKGEAVMIVSTVGSASRPPMAITLLGGVEAILTAAPSQHIQSLLTPWSLASAPGDDE